ncbi:MAG TPA: hypothetical protein VF762_09235 [Blastocatellia bacterium]
MPTTNWSLRGEYSASTGDHDPTTEGSLWAAGAGAKPAALVLTEGCGVNRATRRSRERNNR